MVLQRFSGSVQQGYFHIASSWAAFSTLFTTSILSIYKREIAHSVGRNELNRAAHIFSRYIKMLYFITLVLAVFLAFHARQLLLLIAGPQFKSAAIVLIIMAFYPIHQVYGQLGGSAFYSTEQTRLLRNISVIAMLAGLPITYFFLAPVNTRIPGLGLGSVGLALKTVIWNLMLVQVYLVYNCKYFKLKAGSFVWHQFYCLSIIAAVMFIIQAVSGTIFRIQTGVDLAVKLGVEAAVYGAAVTYIAYTFPRVAGITRDEVSSFMKRIREGLLITRKVA